MYKVNKLQAVGLEFAMSDQLTRIWSVLLRGVTSWILYLELLSDQRSAFFVVFGFERFGGAQGFGWGLPLF